MASNIFHPEEVGQTPGKSKMPEGYRLDLLGDPDAPALLRPDGTVVARLAARGLRREALEREALEDLLLGTGRQHEVSSAP